MCRRAGPLRESQILPFAEAIVPRRKGATRPTMLRSPVLSRFRSATTAVVPRRTAKWARTPALRRSLAVALRAAPCASAPLRDTPTATRAAPLRRAASSGGDAGGRSVAADAADYIRAQLPAGFSPRAGVMLGSGLGGVAEEIEDATVIPYEDIPDFPRSTVSGHKGQLVCGNLNGVPVIAFQGRVHMYEGVDPQQLRVPTYALKLLGCEAFFLTSAVGSTRETVGPGELVLVTDHINMQMRNPLIGPNDDAIGTRFPSMLDAYDPHLRELMKRKADELGVRLTDGVFLSNLGPSFETPAEIRAYRTLGADVVGMSMVAEVVCARHCGLRVAACGVVVNYASGMTDKHITHEETLHFSNVAANNLTNLLKEFLAANAEW